MPIDIDDHAKAQTEGVHGGDANPPMRADHHPDADPAVETHVETRQGFLDKPVLMVLVGGLTLAAIVWIPARLFAY